MTNSPDTQITFTAEEQALACQIFSDVSEYLSKVLDTLPGQLTAEGIRELHRYITDLLRDKGLDYPLPGSDDLLALAMPGPWTFQMRAYLHASAVEHIRQLKTRFDSALLLMKKNP